MWLQSCVAGGDMTEVANALAAKSWKLAFGVG